MWLPFSHLRVGLSTTDNLRKNESEEERLNIEELQLLRGSEMQVQMKPCRTAEEVWAEKETKGMQSHGTKRGASLRKVEERAELAVPLHKDFPGCHSTHASSFDGNATSQKVRPPKIC